MRSSVKQFLARFRGEGVRRPELVATRAMGRRRVFHAYDLGDDTFVFEKGVWTDLDAHASVLLRATTPSPRCRFSRDSSGTFPASRSRSAAT